MKKKSMFYIKNKVFAKEDILRLCKWIYKLKEENKTERSKLRLSFSDTLDSTYEIEDKFKDEDLINLLDLKKDKKLHWSGFFL